MNFARALYKPVGISSSDVVIKCRNALSKAVGKKIKCGHMGTLDPAAEGVLVLGFGKATKLFDYIQSGKKSYVATFTFGLTTDTLDREGVVTKQDGILPQKSALLDVLHSFIGETEQIPPAYSAVSVNGVKAYKLARNGKETVLEAKKVKIYSLTMKDCVEDESGKVSEARFEIVCGSGTYIRSLCRDIAEKLGCLAYMSALTRTSCGGYTVGDCVDMADFVADPVSYVVPDGEIVSKLLPVRTVSDETAKRLRFGQTLRCGYDDGRYGIECNGEILGIALVKDANIKLETHLWNTTE